MKDMYEFLFNGLINHNLHQFMKQLYEYFHHPMVLCDLCSFGTTSKSTNWRYAL